MKRLPPSPDQRGVALPLALLALLLLVVVLLALAALAATEPAIAANHLRATQARALAESGFERALWALSRGVAAPGCEGCLATPLAAPVPAPYDGSVLVPLGVTGGFVVAIWPGATPDERRIRAEGWAPTNDPDDPRVRAHRVVEAVVERLPDLALAAPCAVCVRGPAELDGPVTVDASGDTGCGRKAGVLATGPATVAGGARVLGADGDLVANGPDDIAEEAPAARLDGIALGASALERLRQLARRHGAYYGPGTPGWDGSIVFDAARPLASGVVFVDTLAGTDLTASSAPENAARVTIRPGGLGAGEVSGWLVVNGALTIEGEARIRGLVWAARDLTWAAASGMVRGLLVAGAAGGGAAAVTASPVAGPTVAFGCAEARGDGRVPRGFALQPGSHREPYD